MAHLMVWSMFAVVFGVLIFVLLNLRCVVSGPSRMSTREGRGVG